MLEPTGRTPCPHLALLGQWRLSSTPGLPKGGVNLDARRLLTLLALRGSLTRVEIRRLLWPEEYDAPSASRLRNSLWRLAKARPALLNETDGLLDLTTDVIVDVHQLFSAAAAVDEGLTGIAPGVFEADLLPGWDEDWLVVDRERVRQARLHALERLSARHLQARRYAAALDAALAALDADPLRESAHRSVIGVHLAEDNMGAAIRQYEQCRALLWTELGVAPSQALRSLMAGLPMFSSTD